MAVRISRAVLRAILEDAALSPAAERCGLLFGSRGTVTGWISAANVHPDPARHFELDPAALIAAERAARDGSGPAVAGHYHSHPSGVAVPSQADADAAQGDGRLWLIAGAGDCRLWRSVDSGSVAARHAGALLLGRFVEEVIVPID